MKLFSAVAAVAAAEWTQPSYWEVFDAVKSRSQVSWGFPVDQRAAALWSNCPELAVPEGASGVSCDQSTCAVICKPGYKSTSQRRTRCRWKAAHGFFWKRQLGACTTCDPETPVSSDPNVSINCSINKKNRKVCFTSMANGCTLPGLRPNKKAKVKCKCQKGQNCAWVFKRTTATSFEELKCANGTVIEETTTGAAAATTTAGAGATTAGAGATTAAAGATTAAPAATTTAGGAAATTQGAAATTAAATTAAPVATTTTVAASFDAQCAAHFAAPHPQSADAQEICDAIKLHNTFRATHSAPALTATPAAWLCAGAQAWADQMAADDNMYHATDRNSTGENLATSSGALSMSQSAQLWQDERNYWDFSVSSDCNQEADGTLTINSCPSCATPPQDNVYMCLHFTQNVWVATQSVCLAKATSSTGKTYVAARYHPSGNFLGQFQANVLSD